MKTAAKLRVVTIVALIALITWTTSAVAQTPSTDDILSRIQGALQRQTPPTNGTEGETTDEEYTRLVHQIQSQTERIWGRSAGRVLNPIVLDIEQATEMIGEMLAEELEKPEIIAIEAFWRTFELIPRDVPIEQMFQDLMEGQLGGLYNPETKDLYVIDTFDTRGFMGKFILSHEITHALQDAHFDLLEFYRNQPSLDTMKARHAVLEGDATISMMEWASQHATPADLLSMGSIFSDHTAGLDNAPPALVQDLLFSYIVGMQFCQAVMTRYPNDWRRRVFEDPPTTTRHIIHPQTYLADPREMPRKVSLGTPSADSQFKELHRTDMGEWNLRLFLTPPDSFPTIGPLTFDPIVKEPASTRAAEGLRGDKMSLIARNGDASEEVAIVWKLAFADADATNRFSNALLRRMGKMDNFRRVTLPTSIPTGMPQEISGREYTAFVLRSRDQVFLVYASSDEGLAAGKELLAP
ncbi:MAG: hypothetical protein JJU11_06875 [Candidatus Sumerlaeia bacterium]|nr:hypothetical protein [Candidatus Sumerlaeia bacterium]